MKKFFVLFLVTSFAFTACKQDVADDLSLAQRLAQDQNLELALASTGDLLSNSFKNNWSANSAELNVLVQKISHKTAVSADYLRAEEILGMSYESYRQKLVDFATYNNALLESYPSLEKMSTKDRGELFKEVYQLNPELPTALTSAFGDNFRACPLRDICNGLVSLAVLIGGPILCEAISGAIPVVGPLICNLVLGLAEDLVSGICGGLPC